MPSCQIILPPKFDSFRIREFELVCERAASLIAEGMDFGNAFRSAVVQEATAKPQLSPAAAALATLSALSAEPVAKPSHSCEKHQDCTAPWLRPEECAQAKIAFDAAHAWARTRARL